MTDDHARLRARRIRALTIMFTVAAVVVAADAISKALVLGRLPGHQPVQLLHGLITLDLTFNAGAAFGVGTSYTAVIALFVCGVIVYIIRTARRLRSLAWTIGLGLLLGGAAGNLGDRLFRAPARCAARSWTGSTCRTSRGRSTWPTRHHLRGRDDRHPGHARRPPRRHHDPAPRRAAERTAAVPAPAPAAPAPAASAPAPAGPTPAQCNGGRYDGPPGA